MVGVSTVAHPADRASAKKVKERSGFWHALFARPADDDPQAPVPDEQASWFLGAVHAELQKAVTAIVTARSKQKDAAASPTDLDGSRPAYLLRHLAMLALDGEIDPELTFRGAVDRLQSAWDLLNERADEQEKISARTASALAAGQRVTQTFVDAAATEHMIKQVTGETVELTIDTAAIGSTLTQLHANAHQPQEQTLQFPEPLYTPGMPDPRNSAPAVRVAVVPAVPRPWDGLVRSDGSYPATSAAEARPAIPEEQPPGPEPLPQRVPHVTVIPAPLKPDGSPRHGERVNPREESIVGRWVFYGGANGSGPVYRQVESAAVGEESVRIVFRSGDTQTINREAKVQTVRVLNDSEAAHLLAEYQAAGAGNGQVAS